MVADLGAGPGGGSPLFRVRKKIANKLKPMLHVFVTLEVYISFYDMPDRIRSSRLFFKP